LKVSLFVCRLLLNRIPTKNNLHMRGVNNNNDQTYARKCDMNEDKDPLFVRCGFFGRLWSLVANRLEFEIVTHGFLYERLVHFGALGDYLKRHRGL